MADDALTELSKAARTDVVFMSRAGAYKLVRRDRIRTYNEVGQVLSESAPVRYQFRNNVLRLRPGRDVMREGKPMWLAEGEDPNLERDAVDALKAHRDFNKEFWIDGEEPNRPRPFDHEVLKAMNEAVVELDIDKLNQLLDAERSTHNRPLLTGALQSAVESISRAVEAAQAQEAVPVHGDAENALEWSEGWQKDKLARVAENAGVEVQGTGADGNVTKDDIVAALRKATPKAKRAE